MGQNFHEQFRPDKIAAPTERSTGLVFAAVAALAAAFWHNVPAVWVPTSFVALGLLTVSLAAPASLRLLNLFWFRLALLLQRIVNPVVMLLMYVVAILPMGLLMQQFRDPMRLRRDRAAISHWVAKKDEPNGMQNQF